jgi:murein L,D-transpeptidase YcbB/YkuD
MGGRPSRLRDRARSGWLVGLIALIGGLAAPTSAPVAGPLAQREAQDPLPAAIQAEVARADRDRDLARFYASREGRPLWIEGRRLRPEAQALLSRLDHAADDGLDPAAYRADDLADHLSAALGGKTEDLARAEIALSRAAAAFFSDLHRPASGAELRYTDPSFRAPALDRGAVLVRIAAAPELAEGLADVARMNPVYERLRAALVLARAGGGADPELLRANLERARALPQDLGRRYVLVDVAAQRLFAYEDGQVARTMKVVVGKPSQPTPAIAAVIRYAVFRPYWNVPPDLVAHSVAPKFLKGGMAYYRSQHFEALSDWTDQAQTLDPNKIDWKAVAAGHETLRVRQLPGKDNMMGQVKFMFPNEFGVYLHDTPLRALFEGTERLNSSGCVRLQDAISLAHWLLDDQAVAKGQAPGPAETRVDLAEPVPVYIVYFTAMPTDAGVSVRPDIYRRDTTLIASLEHAAPEPRQLASR